MKEELNVNQGQEKIYQSDTNTTCGVCGEEDENNKNVMEDGGERKGGRKKTQEKRDERRKFG